VNDGEFWTVGLQAMPFMQRVSHTTTQGLASGAAYCQHWLVTMEQLVFHKGHLPRLGKLIRQDRKLSSQVQTLNIDEAHTIYTAGMKKHGQPAYRPAYGMIDTVRLLFSKKISVSALSATLPPHILKAVTTKLSMPSNYLKIELSSNRPNITYATHCLVGGISNYRNLDFLIPDLYHPPMELRKTVIFHDDTNEANNVSKYLNSRLPESMRHLGIIKHYHGGMSKEYLQQTYDDFSSANGMCKVLCATAGASTVGGL
jgi:superfamily II DNA helicase RecQ